MNYLKQLFFLSLLLSVGCGNAYEKELIGYWQGVSLEENGEIALVNAEEIQLNLTEEGTYQYRSTLGYEEKGVWHVNDSYIYTTDTLAGKQNEKAAKILVIQSDTLRVLTQAKDKDRTITFVRQR